MYNGYFCQDLVVCGYSEWISPPDRLKNMPFRGGNRTYRTKKCASYNNSDNILQQTCYQQADIRMHLHGSRQLVDNTSVASCQLALFGGVFLLCTTLKFRLNT